MNGDILSLRIKRVSRYIEQVRHFVYILQSGDGRYYTGYTTDLERRLKEHQTGVGAKFTKSFGAEVILYHESFADKSSALQREAQIKGWSRAEKEFLIIGLGAVARR